MLATGHTYRVEAPGNGRMLLYIDNGAGHVTIHDWPIECMVGLARDIQQIYQFILAQALESHDG
jgi:hypothetical protein